MTLFDMLGIDEADGIDENEVKAIKATLDRIKVVAAGVAKTNDTSDTIAILRGIEKAVRKAVAAGISSVDELHQQLSNNQQPAQLGSGQSGSQPLSPQQQVIDEQTALNALIGSPNIDNGVKAALRRLLHPGDPNPLMVEADGTPSNLKEAERQRDKHEQTLKDEQDSTKSGSLAKRLKDAEQELAEQKDDTKSDSLAGKLKKAQQDLANARDGYVMKSDFAEMLDQFDAIASDGKTKFASKSKLKGHVNTWRTWLNS